MCKSFQISGEKEISNKQVEMRRISAITDTDITEGKAT